MDYATILDIVEKRRAGPTLSLNVNEVRGKLQFVLNHAKYLIILIGILNDTQKIPPFNAQENSEVFASNVFIPTEPCKERKVAKRRAFVQVYNRSLTLSSWSIKFF